MCEEEKKKTCKNYHKINWVAGHELLLLLMECGTIVDIFSKNGSFIVKNYLTGGLLWYGHKCMRGKDDVVEEELYEGTAKVDGGCASRRML